MPSTSCAGGSAWPKATRAIDNVVMMGMGEPLQNYAALVPALRIMLDDHGYGLSRRRVTVSTSGVVPMIDRLREDCPVALAVSLHAPDDALRDELVPLNRKYPLAELLAACRRYLDAAPRDFITFEYCMLDGVNDAPRASAPTARAGAPGACRVQVQPDPVQSVPGVGPGALAARAGDRVRRGAAGRRHRHDDPQDARRRHRRRLRPARRRGAGPHPCRATDDARARCTWCAGRRPGRSGHERRESVLALAALRAGRLRDPDRADRRDTGSRR